jgi:hypothetical protein
MPIQIHGSHPEHTLPITSSVTWTNCIHAVWFAIQRSLKVLDIGLRKLKQLNEWWKNTSDLRSPRARYIKRDVERNEDRKGHDFGLCWRRRSGWQEKGNASLLKICWSSEEKLKRRQFLSSEDCHNSNVTVNCLEIYTKKSSYKGCNITL